MGKALALGLLLGVATGIVIAAAFGKWMLWTMCAAMIGGGIGLMIDWKKSNKEE